MRKIITERMAALKDKTSVIGDGMLDPAAPGLSQPAVLRPAAVLVGLVERHQGLSVLFTRRTAHLTAHAGQVSFPGGRCEDCDEDAVATALRESHEEVGLPPELVQVAGSLDEYHTGTGFSITPVVGFFAGDFKPKPDPFEVADIFEVPFDFLMDPRNHKRERIHWKGAMREYYAMPYNGHYIWGATAGIIRNFYEHIRGE